MIERCKFTVFMSLRYYWLRRLQGTGMVGGVTMNPVHHAAMR
jgi:hypothetical protein